MKFRVTVEMEVGELIPEWNRVVNAMPLTEREGRQMITSFFERKNVTMEKIDGYPLFFDLKSIQ